MSVFILSIGFWNCFCCSLSGFIGGFNLLISPLLILYHLEVQQIKVTINKHVLVEVEHHDTFLYQIETRKKSEPQMGFEPRILSDLVGCSKYGANGDSMASKGEMWVFD